MTKAHNEKIPFDKKIGQVDVLGRLRALDKTQRHAVLATDSGGQPYTSIVAFALTPDADGLIFVTPKKTTKYKNILKNNKVSLMIDSRKNTAKGYMGSEAITIIGIANPVRKGRKRDAYAGMFIKKHSELEGFVNANSTALILITFEQIIHAGKFQSITSWYRGKE